MWEIVLAILVGMAFGVSTGLIPGLHINLVTIVVLNSAVYLADMFNGISLVVFIISMAVMHTFLDIIPAVFLGAPDPDTALAVLPAHEFLLKGLGFEAVKLATVGSLYGLIGGVVLMPVLVYIVPTIYPFIRPYVVVLLIFAGVLLMFREKGIKKIFALLLFLLSGMLGFFVLNFSTLSQPLLPLLSGLFGLSTLLLSLNREVVLPEQILESFIVLKKRNIVKAVLASTFAGWITSMLPAIGSAQAAIFAGFFFKRITKSAYLIIIGGANTVNFLLSLITFYTLGKARNGTVVGIQKLVGGINADELILFACVALFVGGVGVILALNLSRLVAVNLPKINYKLVCWIIVFFIVGIVFVLGGWLGLFVLAVATAIGILAPIYQVKRCVLMGCLMLPVIIMLVS